MTPIALAALAGLAALQVREARNARLECNQQTLELVLFILPHPVTHQETKDLARSLQKELETKLSYQAVEAANYCAGKKDLNELVCQWIPTKSNPDRFVPL